MTGTITIGILNDSADPGGAMAHDDGGPADLAGWIEREALKLCEAGRIDAHVTIVHAYALGLPGGTADALEAAYRRLADTPVDLIVGPFNGENARIAAPLAEELRLPTLICTDEERARGRHVFQLQTGSPAQEAAFLAATLASCGSTAPLVVYDATRSGERMAKLLSAEATAYGLHPLASIALVERPDADALDAALAPLLPPRPATGAGSPDALVYLGAGHAAPALDQRLSAAGVTTACFTTCASAAALARSEPLACEGWYHAAGVSRRNAVLASALAQHETPFEEATPVALGHDVARLVGEAMARAVGPGRSGLRLGLEQVTWLDAAHGAPGTKLGFGVYERAALHGPHLVLHRRTGGASVEAEPEHTRFPL